MLKNVKKTSFEPNVIRYDVINYSESCSFLIMLFIPSFMTIP